MTAWLSLLAQTTQPVGPSGTEVLLRNFLPLFLVIGVFWWWMSRARRKERQRFEDMLKSLKRNDRVQTIGGIFGTVVEARGDEVILKVDEANNVKIRFSRSAIKEVLREPQEGA